MGATGGITGSFMPTILTDRRDRPKVSAGFQVEAFL
jgi:hypothetical protein